MQSRPSNKMVIQPPDIQLLQLDVPFERVQFDLVRQYLFERFSSPPSSYQDREGEIVIPQLHPQDVCPNLKAFKPCRAYNNPERDCVHVHPEFLCTDGTYTWLPRTWGCHAFQRRNAIRPLEDHCGVPNCKQLHRPGFQHCELVAFREWAKHAHQNSRFTVWNSTPDIQGQTPLSRIPYSCLVECLRHQPFVNAVKHAQHDWRDRIPAPLTYLFDQQSAVQPLEPNYYEQPRVERRRRERHDRSTTPRPTRPEPTTPRTPTTPRAYHPQTFLPTTAPNQPPTGPSFGRPGTPPRSTRPTPANFPPANTEPTQIIFNQPPAAPQPIQNPIQQPVPPPTPAYQTLPDVWNQSSDDDPPMPPMDLQISARPNLEPAQLPSHEIANSSSDFYTRPLPRLSFRDFNTYITNADRFAPFANWQMPTRLLEQTYNRSIMNNRDPASTCQMTWWGLLHRQSSLYSDQQTYTEQTLTIPLPTNAADPEASILTTFFYMFMNQERTRAFQSTDRPIATTKRLLTEWIGLAGDLYRLSTRQLGASQRLTRTMANVFLDLISSSIPPEQRHFIPSDRNVTLDALTHNLRFCDP